MPDGVLFVTSRGVGVVLVWCGRVVKRTIDELLACSKVPAATRAGRFASVVDIWHAGLHTLRTCAGYGTLEVEDPFKQWRDLI